MLPLLGWHDRRICVRQHPGSRAFHIAGGWPDALAREGQSLTMWIRIAPCLGAPCSDQGDSFRHSSQGCSRGGSAGRGERRSYPV
jgi:hypothetical protein